MSENQNGDCPEERIAYEDFGTVKDEEVLARFVLLDSDEFVDSENRITTSALKGDNFRKEDGWSLSRQDYIGDMTKELEKRSVQKGGRPYGYALVKVADIREIQDKVKKRAAIRVIEDSQEENPAHALAQKTREYSKVEAQKIRKKLLEKFDEVLTR